MVKNLPANSGDSRDAVFIPGWGRSHGEGNVNSLQYSCLRKSLEQRSRVGYSANDCKESGTTEWRSTAMLTFLPFYVSKSQLWLVGKLFPVAQGVKNLLPMQETWVWPLGQEVPLEKGMAIHSNILAWRIPWTEEPGGLLSKGSQRVGHNWATNNTTTTMACGQVKSTFHYQLHL